ncbi:hypothetical protein ACVWWW_002235 [Lysobacter sp. HA18]
MGMRPIWLGFVVGAGLLAAAGAWTYLRDTTAKEEVSTHASPFVVDASRSSGELSTSFKYDRAEIERAIESGVVRIRLPDGTSYRASVTGTRPEVAGGTTVVGRVDTKFGPQSMVLTIGRDAMFGVIPMPNGHQLYATTTRGVVSVGVAGGLIPPTVKGSLAANPDYLRPTLPAAASAGGGSARTTVAPAPAPAPAPAIAVLAASTSPGAAQEIAVLLVYSDDLVALRGSESAAQTEVVNLLAIANQVHADSGTGITLKLAGVRQARVDASRSNSQILSDVTSNTLSGIDVRAIRDETAADLVALIRPYYDTNGSCGNAWLNGWNLSPGLMSPDFGFSVSNVSPCGPYVLAHEVGHNLGSAHDKFTQTDSSGAIEFGAYVYSFGYRRPGADGFATVMAYAFELPWVGYFSNPMLLKCHGMPCGAADDSDNVSSLKLTGPVVAAFRGAPGSLSVIPTTVFEPDANTGYAIVRVRLSGDAPSGGISFDVAVDPATADTSDFGLPYPTHYSIPAGQREVSVFVPINADTSVEPDETFVVRLTNVIGAPVENGSAVVTIRNDDPRPVLSGRILFPSDGSASAPTEPFWLQVGVADGADLPSVQVAPPEFAYRIAVAPGANVRLTANVPPPFVHSPTAIYNVTRSLKRDLKAIRGVQVSGRLIAPLGKVLPPEGVPLTISANLNGHGQSLSYANPGPPDYTYSVWIQPGAWFYLKVEGSADYAPFQTVDTYLTSDWQLDVALAAEPTMSVWSPPLISEGPSGTHSVGGVVVELSAPAGNGGAHVHYETRDGSATSGVDYTAAAGDIDFAAGERIQFVNVDVAGDDVVEGDETFRIEFSGASGARLIQPRQTLIIHEQPATKSTPLPPTASN